MKIDVEVIFEEQIWHNHDYITKDYLEKVTLTIFKFISIPKTIKTVEICLLLTNKITMQNLNYDFLGIKKPTNVLAFPGETLSPKNLKKSLSNKTHLYLGDIAFGYQVLLDEIKQYKIKFFYHFSHLLVHGILHTLGFDHQNDEDNKEMSDYEDKILNYLKISNEHYK